MIESRFRGFVMGYPIYVCILKEERTSRGTAWSEVRSARATKLGKQQASRAGRYAEGKSDKLSSVHSQMVYT